MFEVIKKIIKFKNTYLSGNSLNLIVIFFVVYLYIEKEFRVKFLKMSPTKKN